MKRLAGLALMLFFCALPLTPAVAGGPDATAAPAETRETVGPNSEDQLLPGTDVDVGETPGPGSGMPAGVMPGSSVALPMMIGLLVILVAAAAVLARSVYKKDRK